MDQLKIIYEVSKVIITGVIYSSIAFGFFLFFWVITDFIKKNKLLNNPRLYIYIIITAIIILLFTLLKGYSECSSNKTTVEIYKERVVRLVNFFYFIPLKIMFVFFCIYFLAVFLFWQFSFWFDIILPENYYPIIFVLVLLLFSKSIYFLQVFLGFVVYYFIKKSLFLDKVTPKIKDYKKPNPKKKTILLIIVLIISTLLLFYFDNGIYFIHNKINPEDIIDYSNKNNIGLTVYVFLIIACLYIFDFFKKYLDNSINKNKKLNIGFSDYDSFPKFSFIKGWQPKDNNVFRQIGTTLLKIFIFVFCSPPFISSFIATFYYLMNFTIVA